MLELDNCPLVTDASLDYLMGCHNLRRLELYDCQLVTRTAIRRLKVRQLVTRTAIRRLKVGQLVTHTAIHRVKVG